MYVLQFKVVIVTKWKGRIKHSLWITYNNQHDIWALADHCRAYITARWEKHYSQNEFIIRHFHSWVRFNVIKTYNILYKAILNGNNISKFKRLLLINLQNSNQYLSQWKVGGTNAFDRPHGRIIRWHLHGFGLYSDPYYAK